jgi:flagella basal body P-ring formation protein FlgA
MRRLALLWLLLLGFVAPAGAAPLPAGAPLVTEFAEALVRAALPADSAFQITIDQPALPLGNDATLATEVILAQFQYDPAAGRFSGALVGTLAGRERFRLPILGRAQAVLRVPALRRAVAPDEMISEADLTWVEVAPASLPPASITEAAQIVGSQARRRLGAGRALTERDLGPP